MKYLTVFCCVILTVSAVSDQQQWKDFKIKYGKSYRSLREDKLRFNIFQDNLRSIEEHNAKYEKGEVSWYKAVTRFADKTLEEFQEWLRPNVATRPKYNATKIYKHQSNLALPDFVDWREKGAVLAAKNQGDCGSCWSFSSTGALEGQNAIKYGVQIPLSEQNLMDCSVSYGNGGCDGGYMNAAIQYVIDNGIESEWDYPYQARINNCYFDRSKSLLRATQQVNIEPQEVNVQSAVATVGPVSIGMDANYLGLYGGGIYDDEQCSSVILNHGVLAVGYGTENNQPYWIIKNSWGAEWGEQGFFKLVRNRNQCGVGNDPSYPILA